MTLHTLLTFTKKALICATIAALPVAAHAGGWGAISADEVIGEKNPYWGVGGGDTKAEANRNAQKYCKEAGGKNCEVLLTYQQCGAYAASNKYSGTGEGTSKKIAEAKALSECNNSNCSVVVSDCND